jgi:hypothetical protein
MKRTREAGADGYVTDGFATKDVNYMVLMNAILGRNGSPNI